MKKIGDTETSGFSPRIEIVPKKTLVDEKVAIRLLGFAPNQTVKVRAKMQDGYNCTWESHAFFQTNGQGTIDVSSQKPLSGTYDSVDPMGLFWSMGFVSYEQKPASPWIPNLIDFTAEIEGKAFAAATIERMFSSQNVIRTPIQNDNLTGTFYQPEGLGPFPGIIALSGSGGGSWERMAALLASHGYAVLTPAYFAAESLPEELVNIPLEYFETAIDWLQAQATVTSDLLAVIGISKGGELGLLLGATFPQIKAVVGCVPSSIVFNGIGKGVEDLAQKQSPWSYHGQALPFVARASFDSLKTAILRNEPIPFVDLYLEGLQNTKFLKEATIQVEKIKGPVLLTSGGDDQMWPSTLLSKMVIDRLEEYDHPYPYKHLNYAFAGHSIEIPYLPTTMTQGYHPVRGFMIRLGGDAKANARASEDSWFQILNFLKENLKK